MPQFLRLLLIFTAVPVISVRPFSSSLCCWRLSAKYSLVFKPASVPDSFVLSSIVSCWNEGGNDRRISPNSIEEIRLYRAKSRANPTQDATIKNYRSDKIRDAVAVVTSIPIGEVDS